MHHERENAHRRQGTIHVYDSIDGWSGTGFLLAPESGARTRRRLRAMAEDLGERVGDIAADARWKVDRAIERGKRLVA